MEKVKLLPAAKVLGKLGTISETDESPLPDEPAKHLQKGGPDKRDPLEPDLGPESQLLIMIGAKPAK